MSFTIHSVQTSEDLTAIKTLFTAYATALNIDLTFQSFASELASLPGKYAPPTGALLLARSKLTSEAIGCAAVRPLGDDGICEMKRLYVTPEGRGTGVGRALAEAIVYEARKLGYRAMRLDTLASMAAARKLYAQLGFTEIEAYYETPLREETVFLELDLRSK